MNLAEESRTEARACDVNISSVGLIDNLTGCLFVENAEKLMQIADMRVSVNRCARHAGVFVVTFRERLDLYMT